jgi:hypothetical protein
MSCGSAAARAVSAAASAPPTVDAPTRYPRPSSSPWPVSRVRELLGDVNPRPTLRLV